MAAPEISGPRLAGPGGGIGPGPGGPGPRGPGGGARWLEGAQKAKDRKGTLRRLWAAFGVEKRAIYAVFGMVLADASLLLAVPWLIGRCVDAMAGSAGSGAATGATGASGAVGAAALAAWVAALAAAWLADLALVVAQGRTMAGASQRIVRSLRRGLFGKLQRLPVTVFDTWSHGDLMSRLSNDVDNISGTIAQSTTQLLQTIVMIVGSLVLMLALSPLLTLAALVTVPLVFLLTRTVSRRTRALFRRQQALLGALNGHIEETVSGIAVVRAFGREEAEVARFEALSDELREVGTGALVWSGFIMPLMNVINNLGFASVAVAGGVLAIRGQVTVGVIASFLSYARQFTRPLNELANTWNTLQTAVAGAERVFEVMDLAEEVGDRPGALRIAGARCLDGEPAGEAGGEVAGAEGVTLRGEVVFERVSFGYSPGRDVVHDVSFRIPPGGVVALVGPTGAGKTTLASLLTRFYDPGSGRITIDGRDLRDYARDDLRRAFGIVLQDSYLFSGTIRDNILYARPGAGEGEMLRAAEAANASRFIDRLPRGYDTPLGEGGSPLSEGQRQLLAIARAMLADPAILVLDEATSSVDTRTELHIQEAMVSLMEGRTSLIIAHRLSTIRGADTILVLDGGRVVEAGSHAGLLEAGGIYARMYESQAGGAPEEAGEGPA